MKRWLLIWLPVLAMGCTTVSKLSDSQLTSGRYFRIERGPEGKRVKERVYVEVEGDSIVTIPIDDKGQAAGPIAAVADRQLFFQPSLDIDVLVIVFKYRPELPSLPSQLTTDFNGNLFLGYRKDWFSLRDDHTQLGRRRKVRQKSITIGGFGGLGTTFISPWTTNQQTTDEYSGFILSHGIALMMGYKSLTVGLGVGRDNLLDRDKDIWVYQSKPWYGLTLSLNLN